MAVGDHEWVTAVRAACDVVFEAADVGFVSNQRSGPDLLWEADPKLFVVRYPDNQVGRPERGAHR